MDLTQSGGRPRPVRADLLLAGALMAVSAAVFAATASRDLAAGDAGELLLAARTFGIPHPPGYPLWVWLAGALGRVPLGSFVFRVALVSVVSAAAGVALVFQLARRSGASRAASVAGALGLALTPGYWLSAGSVEVYPLAFAVMAAAALAAATYARDGGGTRLAWTSALAGLALVSHQSAIVFLPVLLVAAWPRFNAEGRPWRPAVVGLLAGLLPFAWLPLRSAQGPALNWGGDSNPVHFLANLTRANYGPLAQHPLEAGRLFRECLFFTFHQVGEWGPGIVLVAVAGAWLWSRRSRRAALLAALSAVALPLGLALLLRFEPDSEHAYQVSQFLLPLSAVTALFVAHGVDALARGPLRAGALALVAVWLVGSAVLHRADADQHDLRVARQYGEDLLGMLPAGSTLFVQGDNETFALAYLQKVEGRRPDVRIIHRKGYVFSDPYGLSSLPRSAWPGRQRAVESRLLAESAGPVFASGEMPLPEGYRLVPSGLAYRICRGSVADADRVPPIPADLARLRRADYVTRKIAAAYLEGRTREAERSGSLPRLVRAYEQLAYVAYDFPEARYDLSRVLLLAGDRGAARSEFQAATLLAPQAEWLRAEGRKMGFLSHES